MERLDRSAKETRGASASYGLNGSKRALKTDQQAATLPAMETLSRPEYLIDVEAIAVVGGAG